MNDYLIETELCDWNNEEILKLADELKSKSSDKREYAVNAFYWVRDNIFYSMEQIWRASDALRLRKGNCWSKSNLLVGLCRANNISAQFQVQFISGDATSDLTPHFGASFKYKLPHTSALIHLNNKWLRADCTRDKYLSPDRAYDFDGYEDTPVHPYLIKNGPSVPDLKEIAEQQIKRMKRIQKFAKYIKLLRILDWGMYMWAIDVDEIRFKNSGVRTISDEEAEEIYKKVYEYASKQFKIKRKGNIKVGGFVLKRLRNLIGMKGDAVSITKNRCEIEGNRGFPGRCYNVGMSLMNGLFHGINPSMHWSMNDDEDILHGIIESDGEGSYLLPMIEVMRQFI
ncbi:MAG: Transglutaminase-like superfamily protein [Candidatus Methanolliviera sp. GoM_oil]|nr:MAG: Transglutaminase-like superfamily protein [Candidatus Methanolliviera sp. GoM_oil]